VVLDPLEHVGDALLDGTRSDARTSPDPKETTFLPAAAMSPSVRSRSEFSSTNVIPPSSTAPVVAIASRTKISTSQRRHFRIAYANASGISTSGTTATVESSGDSSPKARGSAERIRKGASPTTTPSAIQRTCFSDSASSRGWRIRWISRASTAAM
jgi:hypothetical protein